jgi:hypothetical protein
MEFDDLTWRRTRSLPKGWGFCIFDVRLDLDVRFWPEADIPICTAHVRYRV